MNPTAALPATSPTGQTPGRGPNPRPAPTPKSYTEVVVRTALNADEMGPFQAPDSLPSPPPRVHRHDMFTAVLIPMGTIAGIIFLFALWTSDRLIIPGYTDRPGNDAVSVFDVRIGSTTHVNRHVWAAGFVGTFSALGAAIGFLIGKALGRLTHWGT